MLKEAGLFCPNSVRINFIIYLIRVFKEYVVEKLDKNQNVISEALTPKENLRRVQVNSAWEYFKSKQCDLLSTFQAADIYAQRKIYVESIFGKMKVSIRFHRLASLYRVRKEAGIVIMTLNIQKLVALVANFKDKRIVMSRLHFNRRLRWFFPKETNFS
ncbi:hypothetical protein A6F53_00015 [Levilactobacillus brevis]|nr:hypothetical protein A6F53_00015 [Levilactobacillus brevis]